MHRLRPALLASAAIAAGALLAGCSGDDPDVAAPTTSTTATETAIPELGLSDEFCATAQALYDRDAELADALSAFDLTGMSTADGNDPELFADYVAAMHLDEWDSWRALYEQAAQQAEGTEMVEWIEAILVSQDALYEIYAQAAAETNTLVEWSAAASVLMDERSDEVGAIGTAALDASQASLAECGVPLSVYAGDLLGYTPDQ